MVRTNDNEIDNGVRMSLGGGIIWEIPPGGFFFNTGLAVVLVTKIFNLREELIKKGFDTTIYCQVHNGYLYYSPKDSRYSPGPITLCLLT